MRANPKRSTKRASRSRPRRRGRFRGPAASGRRRAGYKSRLEEARQRSGLFSPWHKKKPWREFARSLAARYAHGEASPDTAAAAAASAAGSKGTGVRLTIGDVPNPHAPGGGSNGNLARGGGGGGPLLPRGKGRDGPPAAMNTETGRIYIARQFLNPLLPWKSVGRRSPHDAVGETTQHNLPPAKEEEGMLEGKVPVLRGYRAYFEGDPFGAGNHDEYLVPGRLRMRGMPSPASSAKGGGRGSGTSGALETWLRGLVAHECAHYLYTASTVPEGHMIRAYHTLVNALEDERIERRQVRRRHSHLRGIYRAIGDVSLRVVFWNHHYGSGGGGGGGAPANPEEKEQRRVGAALTFAHLWRWMHDHPAAEKKGPDALLPLLRDGGGSGDGKGDGGRLLTEGETEKVRVAAETAWKAETNEGPRKQAREIFEIMGFDPQAKVPPSFSLAGALAPPTGGEEEEQQGEEPRQEKISEPEATAAGEESSSEGGGDPEGEGEDTTAASEEAGAGEEGGEGSAGSESENTPDFPGFAAREPGEESGEGNLRPPEESSGEECEGGGESEDEMKIRPPSRECGGGQGGRGQALAEEILTGKYEGERRALARALSGEEPAPTPRPHRDRGHFNYGRYAQAKLDPSRLTYGSDNRFYDCQEEERTPPRRITMVIDRSGSMEEADTGVPAGGTGQETRWRQAQRAALLVLGAAKEAGARVDLIFYDDKVGPVFSCLPSGEPARAGAASAAGPPLGEEEEEADRAGEGGAPETCSYEQGIERVGALVPGKRTKLSPALALAAKVRRQEEERGADAKRNPARTIVISDGKLTDWDEEQCKDIFEEEREFARSRVLPVLIAGEADKGPYENVFGRDVTELEDASELPALARRWMKT